MARTTSVADGEFKRAASVICRDDDASFEAIAWTMSRPCGAVVAVLEMRRLAMTPIAGCPLTTSVALTPSTDGAREAIDAGIVRIPAFATDRVEPRAVDALTRADMLDAAFRAPTTRAVSVAGMARAWVARLVSEPGTVTALLAPIVSEPGNGSAVATLARRVAAVGTVPRARTTSRDDADATFAT